MSKTEQALREAFQGESQANRRYLAFARQAEAEGLPQVAKLFRAAAEAETVHALNHLRALKEVKSTKENLQAAIGGERYEFQSMYPPMIEAAKAEGAREAQQSFSWANEVEKVHAELFSKALKDPAALPRVDYYVCATCGYTVEGQPPQKCPICGSAREAFRKVD